ncbi:flagellar basal body P-ring protein FlgI [Selenomonas sp. F0473]|uniref:flagellar basal body P-ring protein FlgI n=1 Tax=Selenomonas sp. F0473 TaxID=999423 RepID=UPI00029E00FB|nr:flagellar basal body P-ring protein FlgI [Selenomonas sp. F0473]EKU72255.1 hypothetical protein HMPREF9161_00940 [Selenomonas sp. F0473]
MKKLAALLLLLALMTGALPNVVSAESAVTRIKDISKVQGVRSNQLMGYGLVVGLNGTGDGSSSGETLQSIANMLVNYGVNVDKSVLKLKNVAAVMVTATLPPFVREGDALDVTVSSIGDAKSLRGGTLLQTPLKAGNGEVYVVAQGAVSTGGFTAGRGGSSVQAAFPTVGIAVNAGIVERTVEEDIGSDGHISISLARADFTTASRIAGAINAQYGNIAQASNPGRVDVAIPTYYRGNVVGFVASLEDLPIRPDNNARVVINERTGTIVMGGDVSVDAVAITQGGITIRIQANPDVSQPGPFSYGNTVVTEDPDVQVSESKGSTIVLPATTNVSDIVGALNSVGATPRDTISILQAMKAAGALHAELEII